MCKTTNANTKEKKFGNIMKFLIDWLIKKTKENIKVFEKIVSFNH